jgi:hypothetical protein
VRLGWGYRGILGRGIFRVTLDLGREMAPILDSGMINGVGMWPLRKAFLNLFGITCGKDAIVPVNLGVFWWFQSMEHKLC